MELGRFIHQANEGAAMIEFHVARAEPVALGRVDSDNQGATHEKQRSVSYADRDGARGVHGNWDLCAADRAPEHSAGPGRAVDAGGQTATG